MRFAGWIANCSLMYSAKFLFLLIGDIIYISILVLAQIRSFGTRGLILVRRSSFGTRSLLTLNVISKSDIILAQKIVMKI